jgi:type 1 glutamine amidotransferase
LVTGGIYHDFAATAAAFAKAIEPMGVQTTIVFDAETALSNVDVSNCELLTIDALLFTMTQYEKYAPLREQYAFELSDRARDNVERYVREGGSLLGLHTASICFDGWAQWARILGAGWVWGQSSHPSVGNVRVERALDGDDIVADAPPFEVFDEVYRGLQVAPEAEPLLQARAESDDRFHPVMWRYRYGAGRVIYDALGHGPDSITEPTHLGIVKRAVQWLLEPAMTNIERQGTEANA